VKRMQERYQRVIALRRAGTTVAAWFRLGYVEELLSRNLAGLVAAPCPTAVRRRFGQPGCEVYAERMRALEPELARIDDDVAQRYRDALDHAALLGVANQWTRLARRHANAFAPDRFPLVKDERVATALDLP
jgi:hypothetical protein